MPASPRKREPIVRVADTPWGDLPNVEDVESPDTSIFALPGYSDERTIQELERAAGERPKSLPYRFQFVRVQRVNGQDDNTKIAEYAAKGYRVVQFDEASSFGLNLRAEDGTALAAATRGTDGTVRVGDQLLMVAPAARVVQHASLLREATDSQFDAQVRAPLEREATQFNASQGYSAAGGTAFEIVEDDKSAR